MTDAVLPYHLRPSASSADNFVLPVTVRVLSPQQPRPRWQTTPAASCGYAAPVADNRCHPRGAEFWNLWEQGTLGANSTIFGTVPARIRLDFQVFRERRCDNKERFLEQGIALRNSAPIIQYSKNPEFGSGRLMTGHESPAAPLQRSHPAPPALHFPGLHSPAMS
jgi:hypothetical protein